jgi:hypothetical protein
MYSYYEEVGRYVRKCAKFEFIHFETKECLSKEKYLNNCEWRSEK